MPKASPLMTQKERLAFYSDRRVAKNAEALAVKKGLAQRDRNEGADQALDSVRKKMARDKRALDQGGLYRNDPAYLSGYRDAQADVRAGIVEMRKLSAARPGGLGRELPRKPKGKT